MKPAKSFIPDSLRARYAPYFGDPEEAGSFRNTWEHAVLPTLAGVVRWKTQANPHKAKGYRAQPLELAPNAYEEFARERGDDTRLFWIGHASFLVELDRARFVIDPIFGRAGGFVPRVTPPAATPSELTELSAVLVTHGHHDHFDPNALKQLALANGGRTLFVVPRGLGRVLPRECTPYVELSWWEHVAVGDVRVHFVPAQHWHRRGLFDLNRGLWGGYVLEGSHRIYHSGDTGYFGGFRAIGELFQGVDAACLPLGAYEPRWFMGAQHMSPEQSLDAFAELGATHFVGMHWGAYDLSDEPVDAGPELAQQQAALRGLGEARLHVVRPGGSVTLRGAAGQTAASTRHRHRGG